MAKYVCGICNGPVYIVKNGGLGTWHCTKGCTKPERSTNQAGAFNSWLDAQKIIRKASPIPTGFVYTPVKKVS